MTASRRSLLPMLVLTLMTLAPCAAAQLVPERVYYGVRRPIPMNVTVPDGLQGEPQIVLVDPRTLEVLESAPVSEGRVDLLALFPSLADKDIFRSARYAQLTVGATDVGSPVILQQMVTPRRAKQIEVAPRQVFAEWAGTHSQHYSGLRAYIDQYVVLETTEGDIVIRLRPDEAPNTSWNFRGLVEGGFYTDIWFHRIINPGPTGHPFAAQFGDPTNTGQGGSGYHIDLERSRLEHNFGMVGMARWTTDVDTSGSQAFIELSKEACEEMGNQYCLFGEVVDGVDAILAIEQFQPGTDEQGNPIKPPTIERAYLVDAPPVSEREPLVKRPEASAER